MTTTIGPYKIVRQIAEGGFGRTYEAEHLLLKEKACVKQNINVSPEDATLLLKEAKLLWKIHHYSLPTLHDFIQCSDGSYALVMSYVEGKTLDSIVDKCMKETKKGLDPEHVCWITQRALNALHYLHHHGIIHGDVKPQNIIIKPEEHNAILVDYGLSSIAPGKHTRAEGYTPAFAAPEQLAGKPPIPETDLYCLGATIIYALGGNPMAKTYPSYVPKKLQDYFDAMVLHDPLKRPHWEKMDLVKKLSDLREELFGRRQSGKKLVI